jgi:hypothetical protein
MTKNKKTIMILIIVAIALIGTFVLGGLANKYKFSETTVGPDGSDFHMFRYQLAYKIFKPDFATLTILKDNQIIEILNVSAHHKGDYTYDIVFDSYGSENPPSLYSKGDILFTLKHQSDEYPVDWKKMRPYSEDSIEGSVFTPKNFLN